MTILFQGDSVTDCGRLRESGKIFKQHNGLGWGYPRLLAKAHRRQGHAFLNRGISGNRACDLLARWQTDCLDLRPDFVSILVGVNETLRRYDSNNPTSDAEYEATYRQLLEPLQARGVTILLITPFLLDVNENITRMREDLAGKQAVVRKLAEEYHTLFWDCDALFQNAIIERRKPPKHYALDGVHPTLAGYRLMARHFPLIEVAACA